METPDSQERCRILIIDDDEDWRGLLTEALRSKGYEVEPAPDGETGLEEAKKRKFDVAVCDYRLPGKDGLQILADLKTIDPDIEVILATGDRASGAGTEAIKLGAYAYLVKPFDLIELEALLPALSEKMGLKALVALYEMTRSVYADIKLDDLLPDLMILARKVLQADDVSVMLLDDKGRLNLAASTGLDPREWGSIQVSLGSSVAGRVAQWRTGVTINGPLESDPRFKDLPSRPNVRYSLVYPILLKDDLLGILSANRKPGRRHFQPQDLRHAAIFCSMIGQALENAKLYDKLRTLDQLKDEFISTVSHDLRGPLDAITMITDTLERGDYGEIPAEQKRLVTLIKDSARHLAAFVANILDAAKIRAGNFKYAMQEVRLQDFAPRITQLFALSAATRGVAVETMLAKELPGVLADAEKLEQVFNNLIGNALKFTPRGGTVRVAAERDGEFIKLSVKDTGSGIPLDEQPKLFQKFQQADLARQKELQIAGTGLGLSICKTIVEGHHGKIWLESAPGQGSCFYFTLPMAGTPAATQAAAAAMF